jgi:hypothetical protein
MIAERIPGAAPKRPLCPLCAQSMKLIRRTQRFGELPNVCTFKCAECEMLHTEECGER